MASQINSQEDEDEEDYMTMAIVDPGKKKFETSAERRVRKQREAEIKSRVPSKEERAVVEKQRMETALSTSMSTTSKGFAMLSKLGYKPGTTLGKSSDSSDTPEERKRLRAPIKVELKQDRGGLGLDSERKRKAVEELRKVAKRDKAEVEDYRVRVAREREERRLEGMIYGAMKICERFDEEMEENEKTNPKKGPAEELGDQLDPERQRRQKVKPLKQINVLWRGLVRERADKERERRAKHDMLQSLTSYGVDSDDADDAELPTKDTVEEEEDDEDDELEAFQALEPQERLQRLATYLRTTYHYCFWCKYRYSDESMDGCPGTTEEDHD